MSCIVYQVDKRTGVKYAYESVSYWDKDKQQPRSKRKYIGKVDPETGEIIRKEKLDKHSDSIQEKPEQLSHLYEDIKHKDEQIEELSEELKKMKKDNDELRKRLKKIKEFIEVETTDV